MRSDNGQTDSGLTTSFDQPGLTVGSYGYLPTDIRHNFKAFGSYKVSDWFTFGANFLLLRRDTLRALAGCLTGLTRTLANMVLQAISVMS